MGACDLSVELKTEGLGMELFCDMATAESDPRTAFLVLELNFIC